MIDWNQFAQIYTIGTIPIFVLITLEIKDKIVYRKFNIVKCFDSLKVVCIIAALVALFGGVSNGLDYICFKDSELWFVLMMIVCYVSLMVILYVMYNEKIFYTTDKNQFIEFFKFKKIQIKVDDISRIYLSDDFLDVYYENTRIRIGNNFLKGAEDFEKYIIETKRRECTGSKKTQKKKRNTN